MKTDVKAFQIKSRNATSAVFRCSWNGIYTLEAAKHCLHDGRIALRGGKSFSTADFGLKSEVVDPVTEYYRVGWALVRWIAG